MQINIKDALLLRLLNILSNNSMYLRSCLSCYKMPFISKLLKNILFKCIDAMMLIEKLCIGSTIVFSTIATERHIHINIFYSHCNNSNVGSETYFASNFIPENIT